MTVLLALPLRAASYAVSSITVLGTNANASSACNTASACNGWVVAIAIGSGAQVATGGTYALGLSQTNNDSPGGAAIVFTVTTSGFDGTASVTTPTHLCWAAKQLNQPYPNSTTNDETASPFTANLAMSCFPSVPIFSTDTVTAVIGAGFYTDGSGNTNSAYSGSVTNNSTVLPVSVRAVGNWTRVGWNRITGATDRIAVFGGSAAAMNARPLAAAVLSETDGTTTNSVTVARPTIDYSQSDKNPVIEYIADVPTTGFIAKAKIKKCFKLYPWIGDATSTMDSCDATYDQPTPLYAPQYGIMDVAGTYGTAAAYVDGSFTYAGSNTSGTLVAGHLCTQSVSGATAYLIDAAGANGAGPIHLGQVVTGTLSVSGNQTWTDSNGAVFTQSAATPAYLGVDSNACAVAESAWNYASPPPACATINGAAVKMAAYNNANSSRNDVAGTMYLESGTTSGYYTWTGGTAAISSATANVWCNMLPVGGGTAVIDQSTSSHQNLGGTNCTTQLTTCGTPVHLGKGIVLNVATAPVSVFSGITYMWFDQVSMTANGTVPIYLVTDYYVTRSTVNGSTMLHPYSTTNQSLVLLRGSDLSGYTGQATLFTVVGNTHTGLGTINFYNEGYTGPPSNIMPIFAFNTIYGITNTSNDFIELFNALTSPIGALVAQNVLENNATSGQPLIWIAADSTVQTPVNNVMLWNNDAIGQRINRAYNSKGTTAEFRQFWLEVGNVRDQEDIKSDQFPTDGGASGARVGNWGPLFGTGYRNNFDNESTGIGAPGAFQMEFSGLWSYHPTFSGQPPTSGTNAYTLPAFVNRAAYNGSTGGSGGGDYRLLSSSPAVSMFASTAQGCTQVLPYDLAGQVRDCSGHGSAGAYAQEMGNTPGFGW